LDQRKGLRQGLIIAPFGEKRKRFLKRAEEKRVFIIEVFLWGNFGGNFWGKLLGETFGETLEEKKKKKRVWINIFCGK
jgi:hypothetical protein